MEYHGDQATVLPDNTNAMMHFSNQFAQMEHQRRARKEAAAKADLDRRNGIQKMLGDTLTGDEFKQNATWQGVIDSDIDKIFQEGVRLKNEGASLEDVQQSIFGSVSNTISKSRKLQELDKNIAAGLVELEKRNPGVDMAALGSLARFNASYKMVDGKPMLRDVSEVDPTKDWVNETHEANTDMFYSDEEIGRSWEETMDKHKTYPVDVPDEYDPKTGNRIKQGYKGAVAEFMDVKEDSSGRPVLDIRGSEYAKVNGEVFTDDQGKKYKVLPEDTFKALYSGGRKAGIDRKVKEMLKGTEYGFDSDYANFLKQKLTYDKVLDESTGRYGKFSIPPDQSSKLKNTIRDNQRADAQLEIAKRRLGIAETTLQMKKEKGDDSDDDITDDFLETANEAYGEDVEVIDTPAKKEKGYFWWKKPGTEATTKTIRIIPSTADQKDLDIIAGKQNATTGERQVEPETFTLKDGRIIKGYQYNTETGNAFGKGDVIINKNSVQEEFLGKIKEGVFKKTSNVGKRDAKPTSKKANNPLDLDL